MVTTRAAHWIELGEVEEPGMREARVLRQREVSDVIEQLLGRINF
jgi:hypothetical protein